MQTIIIALILLIGTSFGYGDNQQILDNLNIEIGVCRRSGTSVQSLQVNIVDWNNAQSSGLTSDCWYCMSGFDCSNVNVFGNMCTSNDVTFVGNQITCIGFNGNVNSWNNRIGNGIGAGSYGSRVVRGNSYGN